MERWKHGEIQRTNRAKYNYENATSNKNTQTIYTIDNEGQVKTIKAGQTMKGRGVRSETRGKKGKQTQNRRTEATTQGKQTKRQNKNRAQT